MRWIEAINLGILQGQKTFRWDIRAKEGGYFLGKVKWYGPWRKYCFFPDANSLYEQDCLRDIAEFIETETRKHRARNN